MTDTHIIEQEAEKLIVQDMRGNVLDVEDAHRARVISPEGYERLEQYRDTLSRILQDQKEFA